jgi:hypothetical protein
MRATITPERRHLVHASDDTRMCRPMRFRNRRAAVVCSAAAFFAAALAGSAIAGCVMQGPSDASRSALTSASTRTPEEVSPPSPFHLKPDWDGPCSRSDSIDVNLGHTPETFVRAAYCQIAGQEPPPKTVQLWAGRLRQNPKVRRIDVVRAIAAEQSRDVKLTYSDPWREQADLLEPPVRRSKRDIGAVFMFFFNCPGGVNCGMDWANTHAVGMDARQPLLGMKGGESAVYSPSEPGFWRRELMDAKYAGLQFLLLNTYGPDIEGGKLAPLAKALASLDEPVKIALFDDTWTWGQPYFGDFWKQKPDLRDVEKTANLLYEAKWKPFYTQVDKRHWYRFKGRPFIYFYNAGSLEPRDRSAAVLAKMKARFKAELGEEPFVDVDGAYFADQDMPRVADSKFTWMTFDLGDKRSRSRLNGHVIDHAMVKWDAVGRDRPGQPATDRDRIIKDSALLKRVLADSSDAELLVIATWNDLGEGTGVHRNYDYYAGGRWLEPDHFMRLIRESQSTAK